MVLRDKGGSTATGKIERNQKEKITHCFDHYRGYLVSTSLEKTHTVVSHIEGRIAYVYMKAA